MSKRLEILKLSLAKKESNFECKLQNYFTSVRAANGQPLNDKGIRGKKVLASWERQNDTLRKLKEGIEKTKRAIEREEAKISSCQNQILPDPILERLKSGELVQWRRYPNTFFVPGVEKGRIVWLEEKKILAHRYLKDVPPNQYPAFRDVFNSLRSAIAKAWGE